MDHTENEQALYVIDGDRLYRLKATPTHVRIEQRQPAETQLTYELNVYGRPLNYDRYWDLAVIAEVIQRYKSDTAQPAPFRIPAPDAAPNLVPAAPYAGLENIPQDELRAMFDEPELPAGGFDTCRDCGERRALDGYGRCDACRAVKEGDHNAHVLVEILTKCIKDDPNCPNPGWPVPCPTCNFCRQNPEDLMGMPDDPLVGAVSPEPEQDDAEWTTAASEEDMASQGSDSRDQFDDGYDDDEWDDSDWYDDHGDDWSYYGSDDADESSEDDEEPEQERPITDEDLTRTSTPMTDDDEIPW